MGSKAKKRAASIMENEDLGSREKAKEIERLYKKAKQTKKREVVYSVAKKFVAAKKSKTPTRAFSWLKAATTAFTFKTLLRHYAKRALTPRSLNVKLGPRRKGHKGRAAIRHYANQTARPLGAIH